MKVRASILIILMLAFSLTRAHAQYPPGEHWYQNPLGFKPLKLHTSMGVVLPTIGVVAFMLFTPRDSSLRNRFSFYSDAGFSWGYKYPHTFLPQTNMGINFFMRRWMSVGIETSLYFPNDHVNSTVGMALRPFARFYVLRTKHARLYLESGGGLVYFFEQFPKSNQQNERTGTHLNYTTKYGLGIEMNIAKRTSLMTGIRHLHVANGDLKGSDRNPGHDSNGFFVGVIYRFNKDIHKY